MSLWRFAWASLRARPLMTALTLLLVALGMATVVMVNLVTRQFDERLARDAAGIDLVVGAKGSPLQLVLAGVYHLDVPPGNIPLSALARLRANPMLAQVIPMSLGDSFRGFRLVGTELEFIVLQGARIARGTVFESSMQVVLGARVAEETGLDVGARFVGNHGLGMDGPSHGDSTYTVTGVLAATGSVIDRLVLTSLDSVWQAHEHGKPAPQEPAAHDAHSGHEAHDEADDREITLLLLRYSTPLAAASLPRVINASERLQAASPAFESARLVSLLGVGADGLRAFGLMILAVAGLSVFVALFQTLAERRRDMALLRLLGASPARLFALLLLEGMLITVIGVALGLALGHGVIEWAGRVLIPRGEWPVTGLAFDRVEAASIAGALLLGALASLLPAWLASRTSLADVLASE